MTTSILSGATMPIQDGYYNSIGGWTDGTTTLSTVNSGSVGFMFSLPAANAIRRPGNLTLTQAPNFNLSFNVTVRIYMGIEINPAAFSTGSPPGSRGELQVCQAYGDLDLGNLDWSDGLPFTYQMGRTYDHGVWKDDPQLKLNYFKAISLSLRNTAYSNVTYVMTSDMAPAQLTYAGESGAATAPSLAYSYWPANTGHEIGAPGRHRATYCQRSGLPLPSSDLTEDGYLPGLNVHPDWWEPEDYYVNKPDVIPTTERQDDQLWGEDD